MRFCNPFDEAVYAAGPAAVFLFDRGDLLRFDETWTRDAWGRAPGPHPRGDRWLLLRDHVTGFVTLLLVTSPTLIVDHPRANVRAYATRGEAEGARAAFGAPPVCREPW